MNKADVWAAIHAERGALGVDLEPLSDDQWDTRSLCRDWTVRDVLAHMTATARISGARFFPKLAGAGFSFKRMQANDIASNRGDSPADTLRRFEAEVRSSSHPPGPVASWLGETIIHAEDIRRPLGIAHDYPTEAVVAVADFYKGSNLIVGAKRRISGLRLHATDAEWSHGDGPLVSGPVLALVMAMTGRTAAVAELSGEGVTTLRERP